MFSSRTIYSLFLFAVLETVQPCPPGEALLPFCICKNIWGDNMMFCNGALNPEDLIKPIQATVVSGTDMYSLAIQNSSLLYLPHNLFQAATFQKIRFVNTQLMSLSESEFAFEGLEDKLVEIRATEAHYIAQWDWKQLSKLKKIQLIDVNYIAMRTIGEPFPELKSLTVLGITKAEISHIVDHAFQQLPNLSLLIMKQNEISQLKRTMLPLPANELIVLDFSDNKLEALPSDFFDNMPKLREVSLSNNKFVTITQKPFKWALLNLQELHLDGNEFRCDCRLRWLAGASTPFVFNAKCYTPEYLAGTYLKYLKIQSLYC